MIELVSPQERCAAPLDPGFRPAALAVRSYRRLVESAGAVPLVLALERPDGSISRLDLEILPEDHPRAPENLAYVERTFKTLLWQRGGRKAWVGGPAAVGRHIAASYGPGGKREFDYRFMGEQAYAGPFSVSVCRVADVPAGSEHGKPLGRHLDGCRIGFDLGASDRKAAAVIDGEVVFSEEVVWEPGIADDPDYHYREVMAALTRAASKMPRLDAIGGSAAGIYVDNEVRVASLFRGVPRSRFDDVRGLFRRIRREMGVPLEIINDGDVAALAGSMVLEDNSVLGIALGSSLAAGYVGPAGEITGWLNELAFAPIDFSPSGDIDEWSGDRGCGARYLSQQCVFRLAERVGLELPDGTLAAKLAAVQKELEAGHEGARQIWESMGRYLGYAVARYADFYQLRHVLILGRCTSGRGGGLLLEGARKVLEVEFPDLADSIEIHLPDEKSRRVGQSIAAASLPMTSNDGATP